MQSNKYRMRRGTLLAVSMLLFCIFLLSGCGKLPEGMLKQEKELYTQGQIRMIAATRSEERRVGKECNQVCRSRWSPYH